MKTKIVDMDLYQTIKDNPAIIYEIKALLKQLNNPDSPNSIVVFIIEFEPFLEQPIQNIKIKKEYANRLKL